MKAGLFILSVVGLSGSVWFLSQNIAGRYDAGHVIYLSLISIVFCNSVVGVLLTYDDAFSKKRKYKTFRAALKN